MSLYAKYQAVALYVTCNEGSQDQAMADLAALFEAAAARSKTKADLIAEWLTAYPEDANRDDLEQMALAGQVEQADGTYLPFSEWNARRLAK